MQAGFQCASDKYLLHHNLKSKETGLVTESLHPVFIPRSSCGGFTSFAPLQPGRAQLQSFGLLEKRYTLYVDIRPKMIFLPLPAWFIFRPLYKGSRIPSIKE